MRFSILIICFSLLWSTSLAGKTFSSFFQTPEPMQEECMNHKGKMIHRSKCLSLCQEFLPMPRTMTAGFCKDDICQCSWIKFRGCDEKPVTMKLEKVVELRKEMNKIKANNGSMKKFKHLGWLMTAEKLPESYPKPGPSEASR